MRCRLHAVHEVRSTRQILAALPEPFPLRVMNDLCRGLSRRLGCTLRLLRIGGMASLPISPVPLRANKAAHCLECEAARLRRRTHEHVTALVRQRRGEHPGDQCPDRGVVAFLEVLRPRKKSGESVRLSFHWRHEKGSRTIPALIERATRSSRLRHGSR
jgi:hypothetical protein